MALVEFIAGLILCSDSPGSYTVFSRLQTHRLYLQWLIGNPLQLAYAATSGQQTVKRIVLHSLPWVSDSACIFATCFGNMSGIHYVDYSVFGGSWHGSCCSN